MSSEVHLKVVAIANINGDEKKESKNERAEAARKSFVSQKKLAVSGSLGTPARFRVASGRADIADRAFATDDKKLAGWVMVQKEQKGPKVTLRALWRRRFVEVDEGVMSIFKTGEKCILCVCFFFF
jgi:hypothetical protein